MHRCALDKKSAAHGLRPNREDRFPNKIYRCLVVLRVLISNGAWVYGWTAHWRVMETNWAWASDNLCSPVKSAPRAFKDLADEERLYAAVGAVFSDVGYAVSQVHQFSDLVHYIGSGEFTDNLTAVVCERSAADPRMRAFAGGFRTHYWANRFGHYEGTNRAVAQLSHKALDLDRLSYVDRSGGLYKR